jgi:hypothetical protein
MHINLTPKKEKFLEFFFEFLKKSFKIDRDFIYLYLYFKKFAIFAQKRERLEWVIGLIFSLGIYK